LSLTGHVLNDQTSVADKPRNAEMLKSVVQKDILFISHDKELIWKKYCGFMDLSLEEFMIMQKLLLMEQVELISNSELGRIFLGDKKPRNIYEFRKFVPLTRYEDYLPYLSRQDESVLAEKPVIWAYSSMKNGQSKWCPYSAYSLGALADDTIAAFILSSAGRKGEVLVTEGARVVLNLSDIPHIAGIMAYAANQRLRYNAIPQLEESEQVEFDHKISQSFKEALRVGIDYIATSSLGLTNLGDSITQMGNDSGLVPNWHPAALYRFFLALAKSKLMGRTLLPRDIWKVKGLVSGGTGGSLNRDAIFRSWGIQPLDIYVTAEAGVIAMQCWNKKGMTILPYRHFFEFITEEEFLKSKSDIRYRPSTLLINELKAGQKYEIVITNFHGGPFLRYRLGDLIKVVALKDEEAKVNLPQLEFCSR
jgi:hypothetical protein